MKLYLYTRNEKQLIQGIVSEVKPGVGSSEGKLTNVKIKGNVWNAETNAEEEKTVEVIFWNGDKNKLADSAKERLHSGDYVSVLVSPTETGSLSALTFKKAGQWVFPAVEADATAGIKAQGERNIFVGTISSGKMDAKGKCFRASMPVVVFDPDSGEPKTIWKTLAFWNNDDPAHLSKLGTNAEKCLKPYIPSDGGKKVCRRAAVVCGASSSYVDANGYEHETYSAYRFERTDS